MKSLAFIFSLFATSMFCFSQQDIEICEDGKMFTYTTSMDVPGTINWTVNGINNGEGPSISINFSEPGIYEIVATGYNDLGCPGEPVNYTVIVTSCDPLIYWVPNCFTPDGNEFNQLWGPIFTSGYSADHFQLYVFNRWGETVWESKDPSARWDGSYGGKPVTDGVYTWLIRFDMLNDDGKKEIHGHVTVIR